MSCSNNLRQVGRAMHNYHDTCNTFPQGSFGCCWGSWAVGILPFMELGNLDSLYDHNGMWDVPDNTYRYSGSRNTDVTKQHIKALLCPSDTPQKPLSGMTAHNYAANYGNTSQGQGTVNGVTFRGAPFGTLGSATAAAKIFGMASNTDGTSNTVLVAEVRHATGHDLRGFIWWSDSTGVTGYLRPNDPLPDRLNPAYCVKTPQNPPCDASTSTLPVMLATRSRHPGGAQGVLCDGSVRLFNNSIQLLTWRGITSSQGAEALGNY
jgi:prepilin-type processing-associated H-X9-DG protein